MDMSVTVGGASAPRTGNPKPPGIAQPQQQRSRCLAGKGRGARRAQTHQREVDPDLEAATITYLVGSQRAPRFCSRTSKAIPAIARFTT